MAMADSSKKKSAPKEYSREVMSAFLLALIDVRDPNRKPRLGMSDWMDNADEASGKENCTSTSGDDDDFKQPATKRYNSANSRCHLPKHL